MTFQGEVLFFTDLDEPVVVTDPAWFCDLITDLHELPKETSLRNDNRSRNLHPDLVLLPQTYLREHWKKWIDDEQVSTASTHISKRVLEEMDG